VYVDVLSNEEIGVGRDEMRLHGVLLAIGAGEVWRMFWMKGTGQRRSHLVLNDNPNL